ncbi:MAG: hypothetical protein ABI851_16000 [Saprospiraceae bacterium]
MYQLISKLGNLLSVFKNSNRVIINSIIPINEKVFEIEEMTVEELKAGYNLVTVHYYPIYELQAIYSSARGLDVMSYELEDVTIYRLFLDNGEEMIEVKDCDSTLFNKIKNKVMAYHEDNRYDDFPICTDEDSYLCLEY